MWPLAAQDLKCANEIVTSYFEHRKVLGQAPSTFSLLTEGMNAQRIWYDPAIGGDGGGKNVFEEIQDWLEDNCGNFLDTNSLLTDDETEFVYFTRATWQAAAGLNVSEVPYESYRRKVNLSDPWSYGKFRIGDIRGPWCFEDLQNGLKALKWTKVGDGYTRAQESSKTLNWYGWPPRHDNFVATFEALPWDSVGSNYGGYHAIGGERNDLGPPFYWSMGAERVRSQWTLTLPTIPRKVDVYFFITAHSTTPFFDFDGTHFKENKWNLAYSDNETSDAVITMPMYGNTNTCPTMPMNESGSITAQERYSQAVLKWQFSYGEE